MIEIKRAQHHRALAHRILKSLRISPQVEIHAFKGHKIGKRLSEAVKHMIKAELVTVEDSEQAFKLQESSDDILYVVVLARADNFHHTLADYFKSGYTKPRSKQSEEVAKVTKNPEVITPAKVKRVVPVVKINLF